jgi:hypothetical protein
MFAACPRIFSADSAPKPNQVQLQFASIPPPHLSNYNAVIVALLNLTLPMGLSTTPASVFFTTTNRTPSFIVTLSSIQSSVGCGTILFGEGATVIESPSLVVLQNGFMGFLSGGIPALFHCANPSSNFSAASKSFTVAVG